MQSVIVILLLSAAVAFFAWHAWRFFTPRKGAGCGGSCGCGREKSEPKTPENAAGKTVFLPANDLINRVKARKA